MKESILRDRLIDHIVSLPTLVRAEEFYKVPGCDRREVMQEVSSAIREKVIETKVMPIGGQLIAVAQLTPYGAHRHKLVLRNVVIRIGRKRREEPKWFRIDDREGIRIAEGSDITSEYHHFSTSDRYEQCEPIECLVDGIRLSYYPDIELRGMTSILISAFRKAAKLE